MLTFLIFLMLKNPLALFVEVQVLSSSVPPTLVKNLGLMQFKGEGRVLLLKANQKFHYLFCFS